MEHFGFVELPDHMWDLMFSLSRTFFAEHPESLNDLGASDAAPVEAPSDQHGEALPSPSLS
jgi:hypothetical protein